MSETEAKVLGIVIHFPIDLVIEIRNRMKALLALKLLLFSRITKKSKCQQSLANENKPW